MICTGANVLLFIPHVIDGRCELRGTTIRGYFLGQELLGSKKSPVFARGGGKLTRY
jgi:hypothetical protein